MARPAVHDQKRSLTPKGDAVGGWNAQEIDLYVTIGQLPKHAGLALGSPERHIRGVEFRETISSNAAIFEFTEAAAAGGSLGAQQNSAPCPLRSLLASLFTSRVVLAARWLIGSSTRDGSDRDLRVILSGESYYDIGLYQAGIEAVNRLRRSIRSHLCPSGCLFVGWRLCCQAGASGGLRDVYYNLSFSSVRSKSLGSQPTDRR